jgi:hypothetical protein
MQITTFDTTVRRRIVRWLLTGAAVGSFAIIMWQGGWLSASDPMGAAPAMIMLVLLFNIFPAIYVYLDARKYKQVNAWLEAFVVMRTSMWGLRHYLNRRDNNFKEPLI